jgi:hypothetical protein
LSGLRFFIIVILPSLAPARITKNNEEGTKMIKKVMTLSPAAEAARRAVKLSIVALIAAAAMAVAPPKLADAAEVGFLGPDSDIGFADSDGYVPLYRDCLQNDLGAVYIPYYDGTSIIGSIVINECAIERFGVGPTDLQKLIDHEMGHAQGLLHTDDPNDIMYPYLPVTGT